MITMPPLLARFVPAPAAAASPAVPAAPPPPPPPPPPPAPPTREPISPQTARFLQASGVTDRMVDAYFKAAHHTYQVDGQPVVASPQFRMVDGHNQKNVIVGQAALAPLTGNKPGQLSMATLGNVLAGRGSPGDVARATQLLLDAGKLPPADADHPTPELRIRLMMWQHGIGIDCAGYVQQALASLHGKSPAQLGLKSPLNENLGALARNPHFQKIDTLDARPGDVITLKDDRPGEPGHTVLVVAHATRTGAELTAKLNPQLPENKAFLGAAQLDVFSVDSSWGTLKDDLEGGVKRQVWIHNRDTNEWATLEGGNTIGSIRKTPYPDHTMAGTFRVK
jgi:cell wall-associated NlpC family hydrolase